VLYLNPVDTPITKTDLKEFGEKLGREVAETVRREFRAELIETKQEIIAHFNASQGLQNEKLEAIQEDMAKVKSAVLDLLATDRHLHNLVRELKRNGIPLDEARVFAV